MIHWPVGGNPAGSLSGSESATRRTIAEQHAAEVAANGGKPRDAKKFSDLAQAIANAEIAIANGGDARTILSELRAKLLAAGDSAASKAILEYLESGRDCETGLTFKVGKNGAMISTPTMRTFLLDLLATVDPQAAVDYAETVFEAKTSADEYAICLRNLGRIDKSDAMKSYIASRAAELLGDSSLASSPTGGFVEAFDALAYSGDTDKIQLLAEYLAKDKGTALNMPAFIALDRLVIDDTETALKTLLDNSSILDDRPQTRAGYFARADLADEDQLEETEEYILKLDADGTEATYFFDTLPNLNFMIVDGLLTDSLSISNDYVAERQNAAIEALEKWESDARFSSYKSAISRAITRIKGNIAK
jgi:hypothetical protein